MRKAIVTGAGGYIGSVLVKMLSEHGGYEITAIDRNPCEKVEKYVKDYHQFPVPYILPNCDNDSVIFHLAAESLLGPSATDPLKYFKHNTSASLGLIEYAIKRETNFIFASTAAVYSTWQMEDRGGSGESYGPMSYPVDESGDLIPPNNYGLSKLMTEQMLRACYNAYGFKSTSFRFFNVIGAHGEMGPFKHTPHVLSSLARAKLDNAVFVINGRDYKTPDGTCIRDYVDVKDVCRAMIHADQSRKDQRCEAYNLGTGAGYSVLRIVESFYKSTGEKVNLKFGPRREGDPPYLVANPAKFKYDTKFEYKYSDDLDKMVDDTWRYLNDNRFKRV